MFYEKYLVVVVVCCIRLGVRTVAPLGFKGKISNRLKKLHRCEREQPPAHG